MRPEISVVIAAYNAADTLPAELEALARQTFDGDWEVLVCDNGSTDETAAVAESFAGSVPGLRVIDASAVRGPGAARNAGARAASAPLLAFCDADDVVDDDWVEVMVAALSSETFVTGRARRREFNARPDEPMFFSWGIYRVPFFPYLRSAGAGNMGVHRSAFLDAGGFDESLRTGEDLDLCWRLQLAGHALVEEPNANVTVGNRPDLRSTIAQTFAYGVGDRRLKHKYALVEKAFRQAPPPEQPASETPAAPPASDTAENNSTPEPEPAPSPTLARRVVRKLLTARRPSDFTAVSRRVAARLGYTFGRIDRSAPQVTPPAELPSPGAP